MKLRKPENFIVGSGLQGDKGSLTLTFPGLSATLELWKSSSEFCAMRSLTMVSLAQRLVSLSRSGSAASSALAAFYTRNFMEKFSDMKPPSLQGLVAFSEHGLMIRWLSLGSVWWEKLSRNFIPVQCTKLIFVPPWEGFSPNSSRSSIIANILENDRKLSVLDNARDSNHGDSMKQLLHNLDLTYRLEWVGDRKILLTRHGQELGTFQL